MVRFVLGVVTGAVSLALAAQVAAWVAAQQEFDESMNALLASVPESQKVDLRSPEEIRRNPSPRSWRM